MKKYIQPIRFLIQIGFMAGLVLPFLPIADNVGQKIWISILFVGVFFCGWICPFGSLQDWIGWIAKKIHLPRFKLPVKYQQSVQLSRYFLYGLSTMNIVFYFLNSRFFFSHSVMVGLWDWINGSVMVAFLAASLFTDRPFCNYFCVKGASLGVWSVLRPFGIARDENKCIHCHLCDKVCPMNIPVESTNFVRHPNCINCMQCVSNCPKDCIKFKLMTLKKEIINDTNLFNIK